MIPDMTTVNKIMALMQTDLTQDPNFGAGNGNLGFSDVPLEDNGFQVFIKHTFVINDAMEAARVRAGIAPVMAASLAGGGSGGGAASSALVSPNVVPEPASIVLLLAGLLGAGFIRRR